MKTRVFTDWQQLTELESDWNRLLKASRADSIFLTWEWVQAWRSVTGDDKRLFVIAVKDSSDKLVGIAPFYPYRMLLFNRIPFKALRFLADYSTGFEYPDWIVDPDCEQEALQAIVGCLISERDQWDLIWMPRMAGWSGALERITAAMHKTGMLFHHRPSIFSCFRLPENLKAFEESFSSSRRQQLRRNRRKLTSKPEVEITFCQTADELPEYTEALFDLHHRRRLLLDDPGCFIRRPAEAAFYRAFIPKALERGWLRLAALRHSGKIEAIQIGYAYNQEFLQLQEGFNPDYVNGAGNVLRHEIIDHCISEGIRNYDFLGGFSEHKRRWGAVQRDGHDLFIAHPSLKNRLLFLREVWPSGRYISEEGLIDGN